MKKSILITDKVHPLLTEGLIKGGFDVNYQPNMTFHEISNIVTKYDGIIINSKVICDQVFLDRARSLDFIGRLGSGLDIIDRPYARQLGIEVISSPEGNANAVAEHALGMLLGLLHNIHPAHRDIQHFHWNREVHRGEELAGKTIGIIGYGHTGPALAAKLCGCDVYVLVYDKYREQIDEATDQVKVVSLKTLLSQSDIVSIHLPLTDETHGLVDKDFFEHMKEGSIIINTSRGQILDSNALLKSLDAGHIKGACLDVLENEKPHSWSNQEKITYSQLLSSNNVIITPHIAGWSHRSLKLIASVLLDKICNFYK